MWPNFRSSGRADDASVLFVSQLRRAAERPLSVIMRTLLCLAGRILLQGCQYAPYAHTFTTQQPQTNAVVGRYVLKDQTVASGGLSAMQGRPCIVELTVDGTFTATNIPPFVFGAPPISSLSSLVSGSGTWRLDSVGSVDSGSGKLKTYGAFIWNRWHHKCNHMVLSAISLRTASSSRLATRTAVR
jgi:hypothetical protein